MMLLDCSMDDCTGLVVSSEVPGDKYERVHLIGITSSVVFSPWFSSGGGVTFRIIT